MNLLRQPGRRQRDWPAQAVQMQQILRGRYGHGDVLVVSEVAGAMPARSEPEIEGALDVLADAGLLARGENGTYRVIAPRHLLRDDDAVAQVVALLRDWSVKRLLHPDELLNHHKLGRAIRADELTLNCALARMGGAGDLQLVGKHCYLGPTAVSDRALAIDAVRRAVRGFAACHGISVRRLAGALGVPEELTLEALAALSGADDDSVHLGSRGYHAGSRPARRNHPRARERARAFEAIGEWRSTMTLEPGEPIDERTLAAALGISPRLVREGLSFWTAARELGHNGRSYTALGGPFVPAGVGHVADVVRQREPDTEIWPRELERRTGMSEYDAAVHLSWLQGQGLVRREPRGAYVRVR